MQYNTIQYNTIQDNTIQYTTIERLKNMCPKRTNLPLSLFSLAVFLSLPPPPPCPALCSNKSISLFLLPIIGYCSLSLFANMRLPQVLAYTERFTENGMCGWVGEGEGSANSVLMNFEQKKKKKKKRERERERERE